MLKGKKNFFLYFLGITWSVLVAINLSQANIYYFIHTQSFYYSFYYLSTGNSCITAF